MSGRSTLPRPSKRGLLVRILAAVVALALLGLGAAKYRDGRDHERAARAANVRSRAALLDTRAIDRRAQVDLGAARTAGRSPAPCS